MQRRSELKNCRKSYAPYIIDIVHIIYYIIFIILTSRLRAIMFPHVSFMKKEEEKNNSSCIFNFIVSGSRRDHCFS